MEERPPGEPPGEPPLTAVLESLAITHVVGLPDNTSAPLFDALESHPSIRLVTVTREGEAFAIASGLWLGGASPMVVVQNTGLLESGDALRGTAMRMGVPLPIVVTGRGYRKLATAGLEPDEPLTRELLVRPDVDSAALLTERTLAAWGVPCERADTGLPGDLRGALRGSVERARAEVRPVALIATSPLE